VSTTSLTAPSTDDAARVTAELTRVPSKVSSLSEDGINDVIDVVQSDPARAKAVAAALRADPRSVSLTAFRLTLAQRRALQRMDEGGLLELTAPIADAFDRGHAILVRAAEPGGEEFIEGRLKIDAELSTPCFKISVHIDRP
jgi:hypothetical protein